MTIRTQLKAGRRKDNHNEALQVRTSLKAGGRRPNHNEALRVRTSLKAGGLRLNHNEPLRVRTALMAGRKALLSNHHEALQHAADRPTVSMRRELVTTSRKEDRLELLVVRAGLRAGRRARGCFRH